MDRLERPDDEMGMTIGWIQVEEGQLPYRSASGHVSEMNYNGFLSKVIGFPKMDLITLIVNMINVFVQKWHRTV